MALSRIRKSSHVQLSFSVSRNHVEGSLFLLCRPMQTIERITSSYLFMISDILGSKVSVWMSAITCRSSGSIANNKGYTRNHERTVSGVIVIYSSISLPSGTESRSVNSKGIRIVFSLTVSLSSVIICFMPMC